MKNYRNLTEIAGYAFLAVLLVLILPSFFGIYRLNIVSKYLSLSFVAIGLALVWGYCGILSLGQGVFFALGGYAMAMYLKLVASGTQLPDFMNWNSLTELPAWWRPFHSLPFALATVILLPGLLAFGFSYAFFRRRVSGVYIAIVTLALALGLTVLLVGSQGETGGFNGITNFKDLAGFDIVSQHSQLVLYYVQLVFLVILMLIATWITRTRLGKLLIAIRDQEDRVRFSGYNTAMIKAFVFTVGAIFAAVGGATYTIQVGMISPVAVGVMASVEMVVYVAVGGRMSIPGAVVGTLVVGFAKTFLSESYPEFWLFFLGGIYILVVLVMPNGLAGVAGALAERFNGRGNRSNVNTAGDLQRG